MHYWTPLRVVKRAAEWLNDVNAQQIVDIGSGAGKFCVAAALMSSAQFTGLEQSASLIASARALANVFEVGGRVRFVHGAFGTTATPVADVYYFYNPFGSYWFHSSRDGEAELGSSTTRRAREIALTTRFIWRVPPGTYLLTYNGFGGRMPDCCELIRADTTLVGGLHLWKRNQVAPP